MSLRNYRKTETTKDTENTKNLSDLSALSGLPKGWSWVKLGEVAEYINGRAFKPKEWESEGLPIIRIQNLNKSDAAFNFSSKEFDQKYLVKKGDLLFAWSASLGAYIWKKSDAWLNQHIYKVLPNNNADKLFLYYTFKNIINNLYSQTHGSGMVHVTKKKFEQTKIPLPPLPEQHRIVEKIEELFSELDNGIENLKKAKEQIKTYRQAVLKSAFEGRLTTKDTQNTQKLSDLSALSGLPKGWEWVKLGEELEVKDGTHDTPKYIEDGIPFITQKNIKYGQFVFDNYKMISQEDHDKFYRRSNVKFNDIIISMIGANRGMSAIVKTKKIFSIKNVGLVKTDENKFLAKYLDYFFKSEIGQKSILSSSKGGAQQFIGLTELRNWLVPKIDIAVQTQIVEEIERRFSVADKMEVAIDESLKKSEALRQSILKQAFEGKLVQNSAL
ncbi:MAG: restriction endonuclease subunit S [Melioribacteraceae bacterium]|nr:restriction endonuclease subunit S [Melioribacteraceae bacterium]